MNSAYKLFLTIYVLAASLQVTSPARRTACLKSRLASRVWRMTSASMTRSARGHPAERARATKDSTRTGGPVGRRSVTPGGNGGGHSGGGGHEDDGGGGV